MFTATKYFAVLIVLTAISFNASGDSPPPNPNSCWQTQPTTEDLTCMFYDEVSGASIKPILHQLGIWSSRAPGRSLRLILNTPGGNVVDGFALIDYLKHLRTSGHHVTVVVLGQATSMGAVILQAADHRVMGANAWMMLHEVSGGLSGKVAIQKDTSDWYWRLWDQCTQMLAERSHMSVEEIKEATERKDWWLSAQQAVALGFADEILQ